MRDKYTVVQRLEQRGYEILGKGAFSTVMAKPGANTVIRVSSDATFPVYAEWAHSSRYAGWFAPMVYEMHTYKWGHMARVERLDATFHQMRGILELPLDARYSAQQWNKQFPGFSEFVDKVTKAGFCGDWHPGNWMVMRGSDGRSARVVLTDPQGGESCERRRWTYRTLRAA